MKHPQHRLPTTQVTAYVATDGSLWLNENECLVHNRTLRAPEELSLHGHVWDECRVDSTGVYTTGTITDYIIQHFDEIKAILGKDGE